MKWPSLERSTSFVHVECALHGSARGRNTGKKRRPCLLPQKSGGAIRTSRGVGTRLEEGISLNTYGMKGSQEIEMKESQDIEIPRPRRGEERRERDGLESAIGGGKISPFCATQGYSSQRRSCSSAQWPTSGTVAPQRYPAWPGVPALGRTVRGPRPPGPNIRRVSAGDTVGDGVAWGEVRRSHSEPAPRETSSRVRGAAFPVDIPPLLGASRGTPPLRAFAERRAGRREPSRGPRPS